MKCKGNVYLSRVFIFGKRKKKFTHHIKTEFTPLLFIIMIKKLEGHFIYFSWLSCFLNDHVDRCYHVSYSRQCTPNNNIQKWWPSGSHNLFIITNLSYTKYKTVYYCTGLQKNAFKLRQEKKTRKEKYAWKNYDYSLSWSVCYARQGTSQMLWKYHCC